MALTFWAATYALLLAPYDLILRLAGAEKLIELLGAFFLLGGSVVCLVSYWRTRGASSPPATRRRIVFLLLGILFFVAFGEEVSWGQHLLGFEPPEAIRRHNVQGEMNLHNLRLLDTFTTEGEKKTGLGLLLNSNRLFDYFMLSLFLLVPLIAFKSGRARARLEASGIPILPVSFAGLLVSNLLASVLGELFLVRGRYLVHLAVSEIRESNYALLCFLAALYWLLGKAGRSGKV